MFNLKYYQNNLHKENCNNPTKKHNWVNYDLKDKESVIVKGESVCFCKSCFVSYGNEIYNYEFSEYLSNYFKDIQTGWQGSKCFQFTHCTLHDYWHHNIDCWTIINI